MGVEDVARSHLGRHFCCKARSFDTRLVMFRILRYVYGPLSIVQC